MVDAERLEAEGFMRGMVLGISERLGSKKHSDGVRNTVALRA